MRAAILVTVAVSLIMMTLLWYVVRGNVAYFETSEETIAEAKVGMLAHVYEEFVVRQLRQIDQVTLLLRAACANGVDDFIEDAEHVAGVVGHDLVSRVTVVGLDGAPTYGSGEPRGQSAKAAFRDAVAHHLRGATDDLHVGDPYYDRESNRWTIEFSRKIVDTAGRTIGVLSLSVMAEGLGFHSYSAAYFRNGVLSLLKDNRVVLSRVTAGVFDGDAIGKSLGYRPFMERSAPEAGQYVASSYVDGIDRIIAYRKVPEYGLVIASLVDRSFIQSNANRAWLVGMEVLVAVTCLILATSGAVGVAVHSVIRRNQGLREHNSTLRTMHDDVQRANQLLLQRQEELVRMAETDPLCQVANRRKFMAGAAAEVARSRRFGRCLSILLIDIDHFKSINDRFGHDAGDRVLIAVAERLKARVRQYDLVARMGGEEFAVLLADTTVDAALVVAESLREAVSAIDTVRDFGVEFDLTVSIGVDGSEAAQTWVEEGLKNADRALYAAKAAGRNRVAVFTP